MISKVSNSVMAKLYVHCVQKSKLGRGMATGSTSLGDLMEITDGVGTDLEKALLQDKMTCTHPASQSP